MAPRISLEFYHHADLDGRDVRCGDRFIAHEVCHDGGNFDRAIARVGRRRLCVASEPAVDLGHFDHVCDHVGDVAVDLDVECGAAHLAAHLIGFGGHRYPPVDRCGTHRGRV